MLKILTNSKTPTNLIVIKDVGANTISNNRTGIDPTINETRFIEIAKGGVKHIENFFNTLASKDDELFIFTLSKELTKKYFRGSLVKRWKHSDLEKFNVGKESHYVSLYRDNVFNIADINKAYNAIASLDDYGVKLTLLSALVDKFKQTPTRYPFFKHEATKPEELLRHRAVISSLIYRLDRLCSDGALKNDDLTKYMYEQDLLYICADRAPLNKKQ